LRQTRSAPQGAAASESDLVIPNDDALSADEVQDGLSKFSQIDLAKVDAYERKKQKCSRVTSRIDAPQGDERWPGYGSWAWTTSAPCSRRATSGESRMCVPTSAWTRPVSVIQATERELSNA
jgi:hypothetical protein